MPMSSEVPIHNISGIVRSNLCIGCGLCAPSCPVSAIAMFWMDRRIWQPKVDDKKCTHCRLCLKVCPHTPQSVVEYAAAAHDQGVCFGLPLDGKYFIAYDRDETNRIRSASGGATSALLQHLLNTGSIDGVIASLPLNGEIGEPHFEMRIFRSAETLEDARGSHYHPLCYDKVLKELRESTGSFAVVGVPCLLQGIDRLPGELREKIKYKIGLVCGKNVTGAFADCLAGKEGVGKREPYRINFRDKIGIKDANNFNNLLESPGRVIRKSRFKTAFTEMWRNYFFAQECCLYCADFYGVDADVSIKDAWGRLSIDPLGTSLVIVNNREIKDHLQRLKDDNRLYLEECDKDEVFNSQTITPIFKHEKIRDRLVWKRIIRQELDQNYPDLGWMRRWFSRDSREYWRLWSLIQLSNFLYFRGDRVLVKPLLLLLSPLKGKWDSPRKILRRGSGFLASLYRRVKGEDA